jgi:hypothetical protein
MSDAKLKWVCDRCGFEQPRHPDTKAEDMPKCTRWWWAADSICGGKPVAYVDGKRCCDEI